MSEASLAIARKITLCAGLLLGALLFLYPHWRGSFEFGVGFFEYDLGRSFITAPRIPKPGQVVRLVGMDQEAPNSFLFVREIKASYRVHRVRQLTEVALALLFTFGVVRALRKPVGD
jgi:hypothetical protein